MRFLFTIRTEAETMRIAYGILSGLLILLWCIVSFEPIGFLLWLFFGAVITVQE